MSRQVDPYLAARIKNAARAERPMSERFGATLRRPHFLVKLATAINAASDGLSVAEVQRKARAWAKRMRREARK